ncbi:MAG: hypothetical protein WC384_12855 [Prolixibacteraceae bacterium]|jgi:hypothetical protein
MKILAAYILLFLPIFSWGQLFPEIPNFKGKIEKIVEIRYGKEDKTLNFLERIFRPAVPSGWEFQYQFDQNSRLKKRTNTFLGEIKAEYEYHTINTEISTIDQEINTGENNGQKGDYFEFENFKDPSGKIIKVNYTAYSAKDQLRDLYQVDHDPVYRNGRLISFVRQPVNSNGEMSSGEKCTMFYDSNERLSRFERKDLASGFSTVFNYSYNQAGFIRQLSVDFLVEIQEYGKKDQIQDILYKYDSQGNWIKKYWRSGDKYLLEARRRINYY